LSASRVDRGGTPSLDGDQGMNLSQSDIRSINRIIINFEKLKTRIETAIEDPSVDATSKVSGWVIQLNFFTEQLKHIFPPFDPE
jgi:hypothetical protein